MLARPRVLSFSSRVAMKLGHIVPPASWVFRQSPEPLHISAAPSIPRVADQSKSSGGRDGSVAPAVLAAAPLSPTSPSRARDGWKRRKVFIGGVLTILPGLNRPVGSQVALMACTRA